MSAQKCKKKTALSSQEHLNILLKYYTLRLLMSDTARSSENAIYILITHHLINK